MLEILVIGLVIGGLGFASVAVIGVVRLPDLFTRAHAASKSDTLGTGLLLLAAAIASGSVGTTVKLAMLFVFILVTNPLAAHALTRSARRGDAPDRSIGGDNR